MAPTAENKDDDGRSPWPWIVLAAAALAAMAALAAFLSRRSRQKALAGQWANQRALLLEDAQRVHNGALDLISRWATDTPDLRHAAWATEMAGIDRLRTRLSSLLADAPDHEPTADLHDVAVAVDDLQLALGEVDPSTAAHPSPRAVGAVEALDRAIYAAQHGGYPPDPHLAGPPPGSAPGAGPYPPGY